MKRCVLSTDADPASQSSIAAERTAQMSDP
jgi:hypothetical protein